MNSCVPDSFSPEDLDELTGEFFNPDFGMFYQQDVESQGLPAFTPDHFPTFSDTIPMPGPVVLSVDAAMSSRPRSAYSVIQAWRLAGGCFFLLDQFREQIDFTGLRDEVRYFRKIYRPVAILIERAANGHALISDLTRKFPQLDPTNRSGWSLQICATSYARRYHPFQARLPSGPLAPWREDFMHEFCSFPKRQIHRPGRRRPRSSSTTPAKFAGMA